MPEFCCDCGCRWQLPDDPTPEQLPVCPQCGGTGTVVSRPTDTDTDVEGLDELPPPPLPDAADSKGTEDPLRTLPHTAGAAEPDSAEIDSRLARRLVAEIDEFQLLRKLGSGAFAHVYLARQPSMDRVVAVKLSRRGSNEPRTLARLDHPNIVRVFDQRWLADRQLQLLYMEYVPGGTLTPVVSQVGETPPPQRSGKLLVEAIDQNMALRGEATTTTSRRDQLLGMTWPEAVCHIGAQLAAALSYAHRRGVLHRDIKPANILLTADGAPKLVDFNIAYTKSLDGATPAAYFGGSLAYMSPEQLEAFDPSHSRQPADVDHRSDIFSLGAVLWELLTGERPFADEELGSGPPSTAKVAERRRLEADSPPPDSSGSMPPLVRATLQQCLAAEPSDRFAAAEHLQRKLEWNLMPDLQPLLRPAPLSWGALTSRWPLLILSLAVLLPNAALSLLNLPYNIREIVGRMSHGQQEAFYSHLLAENAVIWALATAVCLSFLAPVLRGLRQLKRGRRLETGQWRQLAARTCAVGYYSAWVVFLSWAATGLLFPLGVDLRHVGPPLELKVYFHFMTSQVLHGLITAALSFFFVTFLALRGVYPRLLPDQVVDTERCEGLQLLRNRVSWFSTVLGITPFLAVLALALAGSKQQYFMVLALIGVAAYLLSLLLKPLVLRDLQALQVALQPAGEGVKK